MFIEFQLPQDEVEGAVHAFDEDGNEVKVSRIIYTPFFFKPAAVPVVLYASLFRGKPDEKKQDDKNALQRSVITVSGGKGYMRYHDRTEHVTPLFEDPTRKEEPPE